ncbi:Plasmodium exported protein, unknown function [Plasmodium knowlesi strain H]|uniref:Fam-f protein n=3 Tax=Plasmodium knowlesi TaxID=5850 RepID=A0A5E7X5X1_PLAKH|nr:Plasmodium exported protein, unknown function [Plasmodium knowlesi strain H]OTN66520.1 Uncharacterized protein PKNOH_S09550800 [Plasmodium knowlesi]CAA9989806.1 Plasmodium exported protein, unknown function [Plasmodium knowlesi strain H]SBO24349.1 Plasmodium exported protein, unknown function [Plasmodium knowlesi strain H]SBO26698.1 Plasmodium exported protein, unknown function [Plasmodium knowlesi strain H]VVS79280.1 Plasmodium exported protein, unknown function [Plasmodium knowlesi strain
MKIYVYVFYYIKLFVNNAANVIYEGINPYLDIKKYSEEALKQIQWNRNLCDHWYVKDDNIVSDSGATIKEVQHRINRGEIRIGCESHDGDKHDDLRNLFVKIIDELFFSNYGEFLKVEKKLYLCTQVLLKNLQDDISEYFEAILTVVRHHIKNYFKNTSAHNQQELEKIAGLNMSLSVNKDGNLLFNNKNLHRYLAFSKFELDIDLKQDYSTFEKYSIISDIERVYIDLAIEISKVEEDIDKYVHSALHRFPLKYYRDVSDFAVMFQSNAMTILEDNLHLHLYNKYIEEKEKLNSNFRIDIRLIDLLLQDMLTILNHSIDYNVHALFIELNKHLNGDLKSLIGLLLYLFDLEKIRNHAIIKSIEEKNENLGENKILSNAYDLFMIEKNDINIAEIKFKIFVKNIFDFNVDDKKVRTLEKKIYDIYQNKHLIQTLNLIAYQILIKRVVHDYVDFVELLKRASFKYQPLFNKVIGIFHKRRDNHILTIPRKKYDKLVEDYIKIKDNSNFNFNILGANRNISNSLLRLKRQINKIKIMIKILTGLNEGMTTLKDVSKLTPGEKEHNKKAIIFYAHLIRDFKDDWFY